MSILYNYDIIVGPELDLNLGFQQPLYFNLSDYLNDTATAAGFLS